MAALNFKQTGEFYVAEATVNRDYALHLERGEKGLLLMEQCSISSGEYAECDLPQSIRNGLWLNLDYFFSHGYYPMKIRFKSSKPIYKAEINEKKEG